MTKRVFSAFLLLVLIPSASSAFCFEEAGTAYKINPALLKSIAKIESNLNPKAVNKNLNGSIDIGLMQINSFWFKTLGLKPEELIANPCLNAMTGAKILRQCMDRHGYTWEAVGCYNAAGTAKRVRYSWKVFNMLKDNKQESGVTSQESENRGQKTEQPSELYFTVRDIR